MRILYVITTPDHGGAQVNVLDLLTGWTEEVDSILATGSEGFLTAEARRIGIEVRLLPHLVRPVRLPSDWRAYRSIRALIREVKPDLVHCHSSKAGLIGRMAACAEKVPVVFTVHGWAFEHGISAPWRLTGLLSEHFAARVCRNQHVITVAEADRVLAMRKKVQPADRMTTIHNGIADTDERADPSQGDPPTLIMVARFFAQKDHNTLLRALKGIDRPYKMLLVGDGPRLDEVTSLVADLGLTDRVEILGNRRDVPTLLAGSQAFVLSSLWEGFPISILEAMRAGLPVVASDVGGVEESVIDGETGFLTKPRDESGLREAISKILADPDLRARMGRAGRAHFASNFGKEQMLEKTQAVYRALLRDANPG